MGKGNLWRIFVKPEGKLRGGEKRSLGLKGKRGEGGWGSYGSVMGRIRKVEEGEIYIQMEGVEAV